MAEINQFGLLHESII